MAAKTLNDIVKEVQALYDCIKKAPIDPIRRVFIDITKYPVTKEQAVEAYRGTEVHAHFPDGSEYFKGSLLKGPDPAWSASPETLSRLNARIATMDLSPHRQEKFEYRIMGIWNIKEEDDHG